MATMLVIAHGTHGDVLPLVGVAAALAEEGHQVTVLTHAPYRRAALDAGLEFVAVDTEEEYRHDLDETARLAEGLLRDPRRVADFYARIHWLEHVRRELAAITERHVPGATVVVARHTSGVSAMLAAEQLGVPAAWVATWPAQFQALPLMGHVFTHSVGARMNRLRAELGLPPLDDWHAWLQGPSLQLGLWPDWFDAAGPPAPPGVHLTGFVAHDPAESGDVPPAVTALLRQDPPPVLVTGGSGKLMHERFYEAAAAGCAAAGRTAILVCRHRHLLPDPLPDGVHWFPHLPFREVMPRVSAVIHHGGINTIARALASHTPQVVLAWSLDRPDNATRLQRHGLAEWLPAGHWTADRVAALLHRATTRHKPPPAPVDTAASARRAATLLASLPSNPSTRQPAGAREARPMDRRGELAARLRHLSPAQRLELARRLRPTTAAAEPEHDAAGKEERDAAGRNDREPAGDRGRWRA